MTYVTKKQLREQVVRITKVKDELIDEKYEAENAFWTIAEYLEGQGFEIGKDGSKVTITLPEGYEILTAEQQENAKRDARRDALATVIDALGLKQYGYTHRLALYEGISEVVPIGDGERFADTHRFWSDLQTALRVRDERKQAEADARTAERVSGLVVPPPVVPAPHITVDATGGGVQTITIPGETIYSAADVKKAKRKEGRS